MMFIHPGLIPVLRKLEANELDIAKMVRDGELTSPQRFHNVSLFNIRITGTGVSYRPSLNEYVYRKPENYLTDEFLQRCNGLAVIMHHPKDSLLNSEEFADRVVGSVVLPYLKGDEVWAVAKIYDDDALKMLNEQPMSTSPAVLLSKSHVVKHEGRKVLVEGEPALLDHVALCGNGVWDKAGEPSGVESVTAEDHQVRKDSAMADEKETKDDAAARADADRRMDEQFDELLKGVDSARKLFDSAMARLDAMDEEDKKKEEEEKKDSARKDADDKDDKDDKDKDKDDKDDKDGFKAREVAADKRADAAERRAKDAEARADATAKSSEASIKALEDRVKALDSLMRQPFSDTHRSELTAAQARADTVMAQFGDEAPRFMVGETPMTYRTRLAGMLQKHSKNWADVKLDDIASSEKAFKIAEDQIYADAVQAAKRPTGLKAGELREHRFRNEATGHIITEFQGPDSFVVGFRKPLRRVRAFNGGTRQ